LPREIRLHFHAPILWRYLSKFYLRVQCGLFKLRCIRTHICEIYTLFGPTLAIDLSLFIGCRMSLFQMFREVITYDYFVAVFAGGLLHTTVDQLVNCELHKFDLLSLQIYSLPHLKILPLKSFSHLLYLINYGLKIYHISVFSLLKLMLWSVLRVGVSRVCQMYWILYWRRQLLLLIINCRSLLNLHGASGWSFLLIILCLLSGWRGHSFLVQIDGQKMGSFAFCLDFYSLFFS
jgi:hypothetical protein